METINETDKKILLSLAECNMNVTECARKLYMHRNTVVYHINRVRSLTGLDPMNFYELARLHGWAKVVRCEECRFWVYGEFGLGDCKCSRFKFPGYAAVTTSINGFCYFGERKHDG